MKRGENNDLHVNDSEVLITILIVYSKCNRGRHGLDCMVVLFTACAIDEYHH